VGTLLASECGAVVCRFAEDDRMRALGVVGPEVSGSTRTLDGGFYETQAWANVGYA
jgi:hypothetical protein